MLIFLVVGSLGGVAQAQISPSTTAKHIQAGASLPATCNAGPPAADVFVLTPSGVQYNCTATNTWTAAPAASGTLTNNAVILGNGGSGVKASGTLSDDGTTLTYTGTGGISSSAGRLNLETDTGLSRVSAGVVAVGNGTAGDGNGAIKAATTIVGPGTFVNKGTCGASNEGSLVAVTDSMTNTWGATITGGGTLHVLAYCDGTNWTVAAK